LGHYSGVTYAPSKPLIVAERKSKISNLTMIKKGRRRLWPLFFVHSQPAVSAAPAEQVFSAKRCA
jgi:hypothetical protein